MGASRIASELIVWQARKDLLLKRGSIVDTTINAAPSSTKNADGERDSEMHWRSKRRPRSRWAPSRVCIPSA